MAFVNLYLHLKFSSPQEFSFDLEALHQSIAIALHSTSEVADEMHLGLPVDSERVFSALAVVGPEFSDLLTDDEEQLILTQQDEMSET